MMRFDLHTHSSASDGMLSPTALVERAHQQGITHLALTDHDGTEGLVEADRAAKSLGLVLIPGVEVSVSWQGVTVHIVGLNIDTSHQPLQKGLAALRDYRRERAEQMALKLEQAGIHGAYEGAKKYASETLMGRVHFARFLVEAGHAEDINDVFKRFLVKNKPGYVSGSWAELSDAVAWIKGAGGDAVIAHPMRYKLTASKRSKLFNEFKAVGGVAVEVTSGRQPPNEVSTMVTLAKHYQLLASCGSDFHSPENAWTELGKYTNMPDSVTPVWSLWSDHVLQNS